MARHVIGPADAISRGGRRVLTVAGRSVGIFNVDGRFHALRNSCLHNQAPVCLGEVGGTYLPSEPGQYRKGLEGRVLRCPWHGWEYDITTGRNLIDPQRKLTTYPVTVEAGELVVYIGGRRLP